MAKRKKKNVPFDPAVLADLAEELCDLVSEVEDRGYEISRVSERLDELTEDTTTSEEGVDLYQAQLQVNLATDLVTAAAEHLQHAAGCVTGQEESEGVDAILERRNTPLTTPKCEG